MKAWIEALKSGRFRQTRRNLCNLQTNSYCALGLACEVYQKQHWDLKTEPVYLFGRTYKAYDGQVYFIPEKVKIWLNLPQPVLERVIWMNDKGNKSFQEIADYLTAL